jgi:Zinc knuckle
VCYACGEPGHRSNICPNTKSVRYMSTHDVSRFILEIHDFKPNRDDDLPQLPIFLSTTQRDDIPTVLLLDTQASIHIVCNSAPLTSITPSSTPIYVQGITKNRIRVNEEGVIKSLGITTYYSPLTAANILSYSLLKTSHDCTYDPSTDTFISYPKFLGPPLTFCNVDGHYTLDTSIATSILLQHSE